MSDDEDDFGPSKSQRKRECDAAQKLGEELLTLRSSDLNSFDLPEELKTALHSALKLKSRSALKRQRQYIGKLMRTADSESIAKQLAYIKHKNDFNTARLKRIEQWRDRLLGDDKDVDEKTAISELITTFPDIDRQHINQLVRQAKYELAQNKPPAAARKLYKYLRELTGEA